MTKTKTANELVALARHPKRYTPLEYIESIFDDFMEFHGDRYYGDDQAVVGGVAFLDGMPVTVIAIQKGRDLQENISRNFGSPHPEGYRKSLRLMRQAEKFGRPIITFVNTPGAFCGIEAEERGEGEAIARNLYEMSDIKVPILSVFTGEGGSGGAIALAMADDVLMLEYSIYSILSPEGFSSILWKDSTKSAEAAEIMKLTSYDLKKLHVIDDIIPEEKSGKNIPQEEINELLKKQLLSKISRLMTLSSEELTERRYQRFRQY
ncbi:acetyl-CoA carboxylase carboxyltransferase subunit alpha [Vagococcus elongatus]|uniref:Acetyl-coenzyme A carboxylase carboxyl transferase subunit alpha n=1 Tax=Vagococcus elongatus TaxID=180344 RepID=A0A430ART9_9ENTE|nr:acetyl-CoA carboxylase carboxyltransferase subunit alpha [Vagococcus elongatus]RSU10772.1 acetyl-CoA carboxylase carboxyl transferase subunit alpha [Vagococcus elongatus]